ncbi:helix-turn-helix domain-containing protein [Gilvimarinus agarilyticus]|uniref:AraC family transcriptional regulator n=1 Tax=Gilvimarinus sp. 2_MG-2023 TaxID=3062666 RepID=UPI001C0A0C84|nr:helix-turn-helix domain-containing protein [Gilvimarinus sp. 2_MG-2023]MBU2884223.1 helix-turn-helix domain-containing protein [Gilvimarinus agarilyticus]MDO6569362.1 helix-turn-helix domain-containing protein [Gilvimarinus sp. 2_MG-2023]
MTTLYFNLNDVILILSIGLSIVLALSQTLFSSKLPISKYLLSGFFVSIALADIGILLIWNEYLPTSDTLETLTPYFYAPAMLLKGPLLMLYVASITHDDFSLTGTDWLHFIPTIIVISVIAFFGIGSSFLRLDTFGIDSAVYRAVDFIWWFVKLTPFAYFVYSLYIVRKYHKTVFSHNSSVNEEAIVWLYLITVAYICSAVWSLMLSFLAVAYRLPLGITDNYINFILLIALFFYSVSHAQRLTTTKGLKNPGNKSNDNIDDLINKVMSGIQDQKLYLKANINVEQFSDMLDLPYRDVSFAINRAFDKNFFEFINFYRVEEAKRYLGDKECLNMSIMEVLLESGFNSKSSFQRFFKRLTGESPTEYRNKAINQTD